MVKWSGAAVTLLLLVLWIWSGWWSVGFMTPAGGAASISSGSVFIAHPLLGEPIEEFLWSGFAPHTLQFNWWFQSGKYVNGGDCFSVPLWLPASISLLATAIAWPLIPLLVRRAREGACPACGYDLAGLAPGAVCPECGKQPEAR